MRRFTFSMMLALATVAANAKDVLDAPTWTDNLTTTAEAKDLTRAAAMAVDNEGNSIVTGSFTKDLEFAASYLEPVANSAFIAKYDKAGAKKWAAGLAGAATVTTVATDADGNVYAAGVFADQVAIKDASGETKATITGMADKVDKVSGFIVKYDKQGAYVASKTILAENDAKIAALDMIGLLNPSFTAKKLVVDGNKLYLSASYKGNVALDGVTLQGKYACSDGMLYSDETTMCVLSFDAADLANASIVSVLGATEQLTNEATYNTEDVNFAINDGKIYVAYVASGKDMTLTAAGKDIKIETAYEASATEHAYVLAAIDGDQVTTQVYHSVATDNSNTLNTIDEMAYQKGKLYLAGSFNQALPFDNTISYLGGCDAYVACLDAESLSKNWAVASAFDEGDAKHKAEIISGMLVDEDEVTLVGWVENTSDRTIEAPLGYQINTKTPAMQKGEQVLITSVAENGNYALYQTDNVKGSDEDKTTEGTYSYIFYNNAESSGISKVLADDNTIDWDGNEVTLAKSADITVYTAAGAVVKSAKNVKSLSLADAAHGIYLVKVCKQALKIVK